jgi:hypothetical protein
MNDQFIDGHYVVTLADALETHERICSVAGDDAAVTMPGHSPLHWVGHTTGILPNSGKRLQP